MLRTSVPTTRLFQLGQAKQFIHRSSSSKVIGTASETLTRISRSGRLKPHAARVHQHHGIVAHSVVLNDGAQVIQTAALVVGNNNVAL
jgi:hypothetical protein